MHRRLLLLALAAAALAISPPTNAAPDEAAPLTPRSLWVWNTTAIRAGGAAQDAFFRFLTAPHGEPKNAITTLYFDGVNRKALADPAVARELRSFLKAAHARHLRVDYLCGDAHWAVEKGMPEALETLNAILTFNQDSAPDERYDGFQYDVEPYSLPEWPSPALRQGLLTLLDRSRAAITASGSKLLLTAAIPHWYDQPTHGYLDRAIIDRTDEVLIMDYVRKPENLVADAAGELAYAAKVGKKVWIGVETKDLKETPQVTFFGTGNAAMETALSAALPKLREQPSFAGYAIHPWSSYVTLKP